MSKPKLITWIVIIASFVFWPRLEPFVTIWIYLGLTKFGIPYPITLFRVVMLTLPPILFLEIVAKLFLWQIAIPSLKFIPTQPESWPHLDQGELSRYTDELERLGFTQLIDYTDPSIQGMGRVFAHPQQFCFAEIGQVRYDNIGQIINSSMLCSLFCTLEENWRLAITNQTSDPGQVAFSHIFFQQPRTLVRKSINSSTHEMFQSLVDWREQVSRELNVNLFQNVSAETYFELGHSRREAQRRSLLRGSITWRLMKVIWLSLKPNRPSSDWLGDYPKFKINR